MKLYGQHLVQKTVVNHIQGHVRQGIQPPKALVLSFHGGTGVGKTYLSSFIAKALYDKGLKSPFVHVISSQNEFPHKTEIDIYKVSTVQST